MKKVILLVSFLCGLMSFSQQDPILSSEGHNTFMHNPSSYGNMEVWSVNILGRLQWQGLNGAPKILAVNGGVEIPIGKKMKNVKSFNLIIGTSYEYDEIGFQKNHQWNLSIGIPIYLNEFTRLTFAVAPGLFNLQFSPTWIPPQTINDSLLPVSTSGTAFDLDAGLMYNRKNLYAGFSVTHITAPFMSEINFSLARHYHLQLGYKIPIKQHFIFPMAQLKADGAGMVAQIMTYYVFKNDLFSVGVGYRISSSLMLGAAFQFKGFRLGYNYDLFFSPLSNGSNRTHELRLSYILKNKTN